MDEMARVISCDMAIVGGGLAGGLIALALATHRPGFDVRLIEAGDRFGGQHLWSFFGPDIRPAHRALVAPLVRHRWRAYDVAFPQRRRTLATPYYSIPSEALDAELRARLPADALLTGAKALAVSPHAVVLADGTRVEAQGVIDARGGGNVDALELGWQKFLGRELLLKRPHGAERPVIMDATVAQLDGYRFVYALPFAPDRMFVEDTYYSDTPEIDHAALAARIDTYAAAQGWKVKRVAGEEQGALPVVLGGDFAAFWNANCAKLAKAGARAGLFHPTTGYSLPDAVDLAHRIAAASDLSGEALAEFTRAYAERRWQERGFYRMLDRMLFRAAAPEERYRVLERFYGLNPGLIQRFYAARSTLFDKARVLAGRPPVPIGRAIAAISGR